MKSSSPKKMNDKEKYFMNIFVGLTTPDFETRGEEYFDIGAKYHVAHLRYLYTRYSYFDSYQ